MSAILARINGEPVLTFAVIQAAIALAIGFGLNWTAQQEALFLTFAAAILGFITRQKVTPV